MQQTVTIKHSTTINNDNIDIDIDIDKDEDKDGKQEYKTMLSEKRSFTTLSAQSANNNNKQWKLKR